MGVDAQRALLNAQRMAGAARLLLGKCISQGPAQRPAAIHAHTGMCGIVAPHHSACTFCRASHGSPAAGSSRWRQAGTTAASTPHPRTYLWGRPPPRRGPQARQLKGVQRHQQPQQRPGQRGPWPATLARGRRWQYRLQPSSAASALHIRRSTSTVHGVAVGPVVRPARRAASAWCVVLGAAALLKGVAQQLLLLAGAAGAGAGGAARHRREQGSLRSQAGQQRQCLLLLLLLLLPWAVARVRPAWPRGRHASLAAWLTLLGRTSGPCMA